MYKLPLVDIEVLKVLQERPTYWSRVAIVLEENLGVARQAGGRGRDGILLKLGLIKVHSMKRPPGASRLVPYYCLTEAGEAALKDPSKPVGEMRISPAEKAFLDVIVKDKMGVGIIASRIPKMDYSRAVDLGHRLEGLQLVVEYQTASGRRGFEITELGRKVCAEALVTNEPRPKLSFAGRAAERGRAEEVIMNSLRKNGPSTISQIDKQGVKISTLMTNLARLTRLGILKYTETAPPKRRFGNKLRVYSIVEQETTNAAE